MRRRGADYARRGPVREAYHVVLIVCEGKKTEPHYFNGLKVAYGLSNANISVTAADGTDPVSVVQHAERLMADFDYDRVFCVFDRDNHHNYDTALRRMRDSRRGRAGTFAAITSWPCFELWLLLHYRYSTAAITAVGAQSAGDRALRELCTHCSTYRKGAADIFKETAPLLNAAIRHAKQLAQHNVASGTQNPSTLVHVLVEYLIGLNNGR